MRRQEQRRPSRLAIVLMTTLGVGIVASAPAPVWAAPSPAAAPKPVSPAGQVAERMRAQVPLVAAASAVKAAVERAAAEKVDTTGYAGIGLTDGQVALWWKGTVPAPVAAAVTAAGTIAPVAVVPAAHSRVELSRAAQTVRSAIHADAPDAPYKVKLATDGSELVVAVEDAAVATPSVPRTEVPVRVVRETRQEKVSRDDGTPPWDGGTMMWTDNGVGCTAGFGVRDAAGANYILTAAHCGPLGEQWHDGQNEPIGSMVARRPDHDLALIATASAGDSIYAGGLEDEQQLVVSGWTDVFPGQLLCQSGRTSAWLTGGPVCNIEVRHHFTDLENLYLWEGTQLDGLEGARSGDSGGPVYAYGPNGTILAAGITATGGGTTIGFQPFSTARADFGLEPLTGTTAACSVDYQITNSWTGGFNAEVTIHNGGPAITGWSLDWTFPSTQFINGTWNAFSTQAGPTVVVTNAPHNATIASGGSVTFGFNAAGPTTTPGSFALNDAYCV